MISATLVRTRSTYLTALQRPIRRPAAILTSTGSQLYFHRDSVTNGRFEDLKQGDVVHYVEDEGDAGPVAVKVRLAKSED